MGKCYARYERDGEMLAAAEDQQPVEAFAADGSDPAFHVRVRVRRLDRCADDLDVSAR
jgi:hypothetical protein